MAAGMAVLAPGIPAADSGPLQIAEEEKPARDSFLIELYQETSKFNDAEEITKYRHDLAAGALSPWLKEWLSEPYESHPNSNFRTLVEARSTLRGLDVVTVLDHVEEWSVSEDADESEGKFGFEDWLKIFLPSSRDDYLMALPLYRWYRDGYFGGRPLPDIHPIPDPWLDAMFGGTRGMLVWRNQLDELISVVSAGCNRNLSYSELLRGYLLQKPEALDCLKHIHYAATGQSLLGIIRERSPVYRSISGSPDYLTGTWLQRYFS